MRKKLGTIAVNLALLLVVSVVSFVALEWAIRQTGIADRLGWNQNIPVAQRAALAGPKRPGSLRVLGLGDSFPAFRASENENIYGYAEALGREAGFDVDFVNLAEGGTGIGRYLRNLRTYAPALAPDVAVIAIYLGNDLLDYEMALRARRGGEAAPAGPGSAAEDGGGTNGGRGGMKAFLRRNSILIGYAFRLAKRFVPSLRSGSFETSLAKLAGLYGVDRTVVTARLEATDPDLVERARSDLLNSWDLVFGLVLPDLYGDMLNLSRDWLFPEALEAMLADIDRILDYTAEAGIRPVFVLIPPSVEVDVRYHGYFRSLGYRVDPSLVGPHPFDRALVSFLSERGVPYVDLLPVFMRREDDLYLPNDTHWNRQGHRVAAQALHRLLVRSGLYGTAGAK